MRTDHDIERDVELELAWEPDIDARNIAIKVSGGVVTLTGFAPNYLTMPDLRLRSYGNADHVKPPADFMKVDKWEWEKVWKIIRNNRIDVHVLVGIDDKGELTVWPRTVFVPKDQRNAVDLTPTAYSYVQPTREARAAEARNRGIER